MPLKSKAAKIKKSRKEKSIRVHRRELGLCTRCGSRRPPPGRRQCGQCGQRNIEILSTHRTKKALYGDDWAKRLSDRNKSIELFNTALKAEVFGPHPGYCDVKIRPFIYNAMSQRQERLPGMEIELLVSSEAEVHEMFEVMKSCLSDWIAGVTRRSYE